MSEWQKVKIGDVCTITKGATGIKKAVAGEYPMVTLAEERTTHNEFQFDCEAVIIPLVSSTGHGHASMKRVHYQEGKFAIGSILCAVVPNDTDFLNPKYLHIYLSYLKDKLLVPLMRGAANVSLSISNIKTVEVIVPPIERQLEIIELEKVLRNQKGKLDEQNSFQQSHLTLLRQQILQDAISGKLTADWRAENPDTEPVSKLLEQIKAEKEKLIAEKKIKKEKLLPKIAEDKVPFELPEGWEWCRLSECGITNPRNYLDDELDVSFIPMPLISSDFNKTPEFEIRKWKNIKSGFTHFAEGDVAVAKITPCFENSKACVFKNIKNHYGAGTTELHVFRPIENTVLSSYIYLNLKTSKFLKEGEYNMRGVAGQKRVPSDYFKSFCIPLPPCAEQRAIVAKVERLMGYVSQLEEKIAQNANSAETLMQAFLGEVFRK